jgi:hypothetical protein
VAGNRPTDPGSLAGESGGVHGNLGVQIGDHNVQHNVFNLAPTLVVWPVRVGVPPLVADHYRDRAEGRQLSEALASGEAAVLVGARPVAGVVVSGLGGVGKSQLAAQYAWSLWSDASIDVAVWVSALSRDALVTAYAEVARQVLREQDPGVADLAPEDAAQRLRAWLAGTERWWVVVLDDVQDPQDVRGLWPPHSATGRVVVTSRRRDAALGATGHRVIELGVYTQAEAIGYLTETLPDRAHDAADVAQLELLAEDLGRLPLALAQAGAFLIDRPLLTVAEYRQEFADRRKTLAELMPTPSDLPDQHEATVATTWSLSIERADQLPPERYARSLLEVASLLDPNGIPLSVFNQAVALARGADAADREIDTAVKDGLACLHRFHLVTLDRDRSSRAVTVHALVQRAVRDACPSDRLRDLALLTATSLLFAWPATDTTDLELAQTLRACADSLHTHATPALWHIQGHPVLFRNGQSLGESGQVTAAISYFRDLSEEGADHLGPDHRSTLTARYHAANWRAASGDVAGAVAEFEALLADQQPALGPEARGTLRTRQALASWRGKAGDVLGAIAEMRPLVADLQRVLGPDDPDTLIGRGNLASLLGEAGDVLGAIAEMRPLVADLQRVLGPDDPHTLTLRHNLASAMGEAGDAVGAAADLESVLADRQRLLGPDHPDTMLTRYYLAFWRGESGDIERAFAESEALLADQQRLLGLDHPDTLVTRRNVARWRGEAGDLAGAIVEFEVLVVDQQRVLGPDHPDTLVTRGNLALCRGKAGEPARAAAEFEMLLADQQRVLGSDHRHTLITQDFLKHWRNLSEE